MLNGNGASPVAPKIEDPIQNTAQGFSGHPKYIRSSIKSPCPVCGRTKDRDCSLHPDGQTAHCKTYANGVGHDESKWHYNGVNELGFQGKFIRKEDREFIKSPRPLGTKYYNYPNRDGSPLVRVGRSDYVDRDKKIWQEYWNGKKWVKGNPDRVKPLIPIYRYPEVKKAIQRQELIFIVEGESAADALWSLGIAATTTIGGSGGYANYGIYLEDLSGARLILAPDRDSKGLEYMSNFERDFPDQSEGYYLAGTLGLWQSPQGGMDIHDDIRDHGYTKEEILKKIITPDEYQQILIHQPERAQPPAELSLDGGTPHFTTSWSEGLKWEAMESTPEGGTKRVRKLVGNHIEAIAYVENPEGAGTGILLEFRTQRGKARRVLVPRIALTGDGLEALRFLVDRGYYYVPKQKRLLVDYLFGLGGEVERVYTLAEQTGWVNGSFLTPAKTYGDPDLRFRDPEPDHTLTEIKGTLASWTSEVAAKCAKNSRLIFSLGTAFAAPLLPLAQIESGGFHLVGTTSIGKTTTLNLAASVAGLKNLPNWRSTANALEGKAAEFNHLLLPLDEIGQADPQTVGASAYMLGNGQGKNRMAKTLNTVKPKTWELLFLSTGEVAMVEYLRQAKMPASGGMEARMPSIPADAGLGYGVFEHLHGYQNSGEFVAALETAIRQNQGTALDCYLTKLVEESKAEGFDKQLRGRVHAIARALSQQYNDAAIARVAVRFALVQVGLEIAHSYDLLPFPREQCAWAVGQMFSAWVNVRGGEGSIEIKEACTKIEHLLESSQYGDRIQILRKDAQSQTYSVDDRSPCRNLVAYKAADFLTNSIEYWVPQTVFNQEFAAGVDRVELIKEMQVRGWLKLSGDKNRATLRRSIGKKRQYFFVFREFWLDSEHDSGEEQKPLNQLNQLNHPLENGVDNEVQGGAGWFNAENQSEPTEPTCNKKENTNWLQPGSVGSVQKNPTEPTLNHPETLPERVCDGVGSVGSVGSTKNQASQNAPEKFIPFKVGERVQYIGGMTKYRGYLGTIEAVYSTRAQILWDKGKTTELIPFVELEVAE